MISFEINVLSLQLLLWEFKIVDERQERKDWNRRSLDRIHYAAGSLRELNLGQEPNYYHLLSKNFWGCRILTWPTPRAWFLIWFTVMEGARTPLWLHFSYCLLQTGADRGQRRSNKGKAMEWVSWNIMSTWSACIPSGGITSADSEAEGEHGSDLTS